MCSENSRKRDEANALQRGARSTWAAVAAALLVSPLTAVAQDDGFEIEEIIVTAQKRSERLLDVPVSISVFTGDAIDQTGVRELKDVADYIPNLQISEATTSARP